MVWKPDYLTLAEGRDFLRDTESVDDVQTAVWITAASRAIDEHCHRQFGSTTSAARIYRSPAAWDPDLCLWVIDIDDVQNATGMTVNGVALASSGAVLLPDNAPSEGRPYERLGWSSRFTASPLTVVTAWGWTTVPTPVKGAARLQLSRFAARRDSPYGVAGSPSEGSELRLQARIDPDVAMSLRGLGRERWPW